MAYPVRKYHEFPSGPGGGVFNLNQVKLAKAAASTSFPIDKNSAISLFSE